MVSNTDYRSAFKIGIPMKDLNKVYEETFWPTIVSAQEMPSTRPTRSAYVFCAVNSALFIMLWSVRGEQFL
jgi:hypothetical protein